MAVKQLIQRMAMDIKTQSFILGIHKSFRKVNKKNFGAIFFISKGEKSKIGNSFFLPQMVLTWNCPFTLTIHVVKTDFIWRYIESRTIEDSQERVMEVVSKVAIKR